MQSLHTHCHYLSDPLSLSPILPFPFSYLTFCQAFRPLAKAAKTFTFDHLTVYITLGIRTRQFLLGAMGAHFVVNIYRLIWDIVIQISLSHARQECLASPSPSLSLLLRNLRHPRTVRLQFKVDNLCFMTFFLSLVSTLFSLFPFLIVVVLFATCFWLFFWRFQLFLRLFILLLL